MQDKHIHIEQDSQLLKTIYSEVDRRLVMNDHSFRKRLGVKFCFYFTLFILTYTLLYTVHNPAYFILSYVLYGFVSLLFAFNFAHDLSHNSVFKNNQFNHIGFVLIYTVLGAHAEAWKLRHVHSHHYAPNVKDYDSDLQITTLIRVIPQSKYHWYHKYQHYYAPFAYMSYSLFWIFIKDFYLLFSKDEYTAVKDAKYHLSFWVQKIIYICFILLLPLLYSGQNWTTVIIGFLMMHLFLSLFLLFTFFMTHHVEHTAYPTTDENGYITTSWMMNQIKSSNDMHPFSETANFILGGFNNHIAHHLFPHVHHIHYPKLNVILYDVLKRNDIQPNYTTYWGGIVSHLKLLKKMGKAF